MKPLFSVLGRRRILLAALAFAFVQLLTACSSATVSGGVSVHSGWYGPWGYDNYWYDGYNPVIVGPPIHPHPPVGGVRPDPPRPAHPIYPATPRPMPRAGGGGGRRR
ncbi:MAG: hypothetical protein ACRERR_07545 [Moraxellaceae bacterium]